VINSQDKVKGSTQARIEVAIEKLDFKPDFIARTMIKKESRVIGLILPTLTNEYWATLAEVIQNELWEMGYTLMLCTIHNDEANKAAAYLKSFAERKIDGIVIGSISMENAETRSLIEWFIKSGIPIVTFEQVIPGASRVTGDYVQGVLEAVQHLIKLGHQKIAYIHGSNNMDDRETGYRKALTINNLEFDEKLVVRTYPDKKSGYAAAKMLLKAEVKFTALFCWNDCLALGAMKALQEEKIRIPQDVAVVGFDNVATASYSNPPLTTVDLPAERIGKTLVGLLVENINHIGEGSGEKNIGFHLKLIVRESCGSR
jgi:DNA-binding LacI/PurR family transcriptional regulator